MTAAPTALAIALAIAAACSASAPAGPTPESTAASEPAAQPTQVPTEQAPAHAAEPGGELRVVVRILEEGPLGHGNCTQRSYRVEIVATIAGDPPPSPGWIHFEHCEGAAPSFDASSLEKGGTYRLVLRRGASSNFGKEPMIVGGEREPAP